MKLSRRGFLGKALKGLVVAAIAPILPTVTKSITANPVPDITIEPYGVGETVSFQDLKGRAIESRKYEFSCKDFSPQIEIIEYTPGMEIPYTGNSKVKPGCTDCMHTHACTATGKKFVKHDAVKHKPFIPEIWSKKLQAEWYKEGFCKTKLL